MAEILPRDRGGDTLTCVRGIILAGGTGSRLHPITLGISKQLVPVYDKPMIYYPLTVLMLVGIRDILIITTPDDQAAFQRLLGDGAQWGIKLTYTVQASPNGLAQAFVLGADFIGEDSVALVLGDNIFYGAGFGGLLQQFYDVKGAGVFAYRVKNPSEYGVVEFDETGRAVSIEEKPKHPKSPLRDSRHLLLRQHGVVQIAHDLMPSHRGEYEITDVNLAYLESGELQVVVLPRGIAWLDTGTPTSLLDASNYVRTIEQREGLRVGAPEEVAWRRGFIDDNQLRELAKGQLKSGYGHYLQSLLDE